MAVSTFHHARRIIGRRVHRYVTRSSPTVSPEASMVPSWLNPIARTTPEKARKRLASWPRLHQPAACPTHHNKPWHHTRTHARKHSKIRGRASKGSKPDPAVTRERRRAAARAVDALRCCDDPTRSRVAGAATCVLALFMSRELVSARPSLAVVVSILRNASCRSSACAPNVTSDSNFSEGPAVCARRSREHTRIHASTHANRQHGNLEHHKGARKKDQEDGRARNHTKHRVPLPHNCTEFSSTSSATTLASLSRPSLRSCLVRHDHTGTRGQQTAIPITTISPSTFGSRTQCSGSSERFADVCTRRATAGASWPGARQNCAGVGLASGGGGGQCTRRSSSTACACDQWPPWSGDGRARVSRAPRWWGGQCLVALPMNSGPLAGGSGPTKPRRVPEQPA